MDKKESSFMALVGLVCPLKGEKKLLLKQKKLGFSVKVNTVLQIVWKTIEKANHTGKSLWRSQFLLKFHDQTLALQLY